MSDPAVPFCCSGCQSVYSFVQNQGLSAFYDIRRKILASGQLKHFPKPKSAPESTKEDFSYLKSPDFVKAYTSKPQTDTAEMRFYLEGVHCSACVWVVEKLGAQIPGIKSIRLSLGDHVATVTSDRAHANEAFAEAAVEFSKLGYKPHPVAAGAEEALQKKENRRLLTQIAVAGACAGNIMLLAICLYAGLVGSMAVYFKWTQALLFLPVLVYSAQPLLKSFALSFRQRSVSIDVPVAIGIVLGSAISYTNLFSGRDEIYFDSISALIFLLLGSRYILRRAHQVSLNQSHLLNFITPAYANQVVDQFSEPQKVRIDSLKPGDTIEVRVGETIPADGLILRGASSVDQALLTGESRPVVMKAGSVVYAGTINQLQPIVVQVTRLGYETRLGKILKLAESGSASKASILKFSDRIGQVFTTGLLGIVCFVFFYKLSQGWSIALNEALALSFVACPCAFALSAPFAMSRMIGLLAKDRILVKDSLTLEKLSQAEEVFFDKTGTLTRGELKVIQWERFGLDPTILRACYAIESFSNHPVARAICDYLKEKGLPLQRTRVSQFSEVLGYGVTGDFENASYSIHQNRDENLAGTTLQVLRNGLIVARVILEDLPREDSYDSVQKLKSLGLDIHLLSGDDALTVKRIASPLEIPEDHCYAQMSPEAKAALVKQHPRALMVGDGANDSAALASAFVGIAVHNGAELSLRASDVYSCDPGIASVVKIVIASRSAMNVIYRNFGISLLYNVAAAIGALNGWINPLFAAVLMPVSALTLFASTYFGTRKLHL